MKFYIGCAIKAMKTINGQRIYIELGDWLCLVLVLQFLLQLLGVLGVEQPSV